VTQPSSNLSTTISAAKYGLTESAANAPKDFFSIRMVSVVELINTAKTLTDK